MKVEIDEERSIATVHPVGKLKEADFELANILIDSYLDKHNSLNGLVVCAPEFPGWDSFKAFFSHFSFVKDHHKQIKRVAFATDSVMGKFADGVVDHLVDAEVKQFPAKSLQEAKAWAESGNSSKQTA